MLFSKHFEIIATGHSAVFIHNFDNHGGGFKTGDACQITTCFGVACAAKYATGLCFQRENMPRLNNVFGASIACNCSLNSARTVSSRDTGSDTLGRFNRQCERCAVARLVAVAFNHHAQSKLLAALFVEGQTDQTSGIGGHKVDILWAHHRRSHH